MVATETSSTADNTGLLLQTLTSAFNMFMSTQTSAASTSLTVSRAATPHQLLSPPPTVETELDICILAFAAACNLSTVVIDSIWAHLSKYDYSPDAICKASPERLKEITALSEGQVLALKKFTRQWCGRIEAKRAKQAT
jgi:hypothetical protein